MTYFRYIVVLVLLLFSVSCEKNNSNDIVKKPFEYEAFPSNLKEPVNSVFFIDSKTGFATVKGNVLKTTDGGLTWKPDSVSNLPLNVIYFVNNKIGYAAGGKSNCDGTGCTTPGSVIYKTNDSGNHWEKLNIPYKGSELNSISFINENIGFAVGLGLHIKTVDGGKTWNQFELGYQGLITKIAFINSQTGICAGLFGNIYRTMDQGESWTKSDNESNGHIYDFCFVNEEVGYAGGQKEIIKTIDGGKTWKTLANSPSEIYFIHFSDVDNGIAIGKGHYTGGDWGIWTKAVYSTSDGGKTWKKKDNIELGYSTSFFDKDNGYSIVPNKTFKILMR